MIPIARPVREVAQSVPAWLPNLLLVCFAALVILLLLRAALGVALGNWMIRGLPRLQPRRFVERLRAEAFADPARVIAALSGNNAGAYLHHLWGGAGNEVRGAEADIAQGSSSAAERLKPVTETAWPSRPLTARALSLPGGWSLAVAVLPPPQRNNEAYFAGIAVPTAALAAGNDDAARRAVRFFQLNRWSMNRDTDFIEHTTAGRELTYNIGTDVNVESFAAAVAKKLNTPPRSLAPRVQTGARSPRVHS